MEGKCSFTFWILKNQPLIRKSLETPDPKPEKRTPNKYQTTKFN